MYCCSVRSTKQSHHFLIEMYDAKPFAYLRFAGFLFHSETLSFLLLPGSPTLAETILCNASGTANLQLFIYVDCETLFKNFIT